MDPSHHSKGGGEKGGGEAEDRQEAALVNCMLESATRLLASEVVFAVGSAAAPVLSLTPTDACTNEFEFVWMFAVPWCRPTCTLAFLARSLRCMRSMHLT